MKALWALGFRPFYLLASLLAALSVPLWALQFAGLGRSYVESASWHGHEMLFGFTMAVIAGFLFTAARNWTRRPTPHGQLLAAYALLWIAGRILVLTPFALASAIVNAAFPLAVAFGIGVPLVRSGNRRNYFFIALLAGVALAVLAFHLWRVSLQAGHDVVLFIVAVVGGRVIPMFTNNGVPGAGAARHPWLERASLGAVLVLVSLDVVGMNGPPMAAFALVVAILHATRLALWRPFRTWRVPLVWSLHAAYAWVVVHLALRAAAEMGWTSHSLATHALTIGVIGGMTLAMMTRTARGHTGLTLKAGNAEVACYALVQLAAVTRVFGGLAMPSQYIATVMVSAILWSAAFAIYFVRYWPILTRPRVDGAPG